MLIAQPLVMALLSPYAGRLSDHIESRFVASLGMGLTAIGLILLTQLGEQTSLVYLILTLMLLGAGFALFSSPNANAVMSSVERRYYGVASAILGTMRLVGQMLSMGVATLIFSVLVGHVRITPEVHAPFLKAVQLAFGLFALACALGVGVSLARGNVRPSNAASPPPKA